MTIFAATCTIALFGNEAVGTLVTFLAKFDQMSYMLCLILMLSVHFMFIMSMYGNFKMADKPNLFSKYMSGNFPGTPDHVISKWLTSQIFFLSIAARVW